MIKQIAIIGATASGKSGASIKLAKKFDGYILSLDSLSIYKEIDIASAKPTIEEREGIKHFGIDEIYPNQPFSVNSFIDIYKKAYSEATKDNKALIIVGGSSFYLKMLIDGLSYLPKISNNTIKQTQEALKDLSKSYKMLYNIDSNYMKDIKSNDRYRIEKALNIYYQTNTTPTQYFRDNPPTPIIKNSIPIYEIQTQREILRERIRERTYQMIDNGLIDEVAYLEKKYLREPNPMKSIGVKEVIEYLDGNYSKDEMIEKIIINTSKLAKRQVTFNQSQFSDKTSLSLDEIKRIK
ncbi:tRNA dimethylallyltransferase [hydrothermal vent metagenome]|uniref:tRNA dimethylallyltransferase n=1 Tax=hydrothermal vent metagenome TaxID=652676 RepID=A0A1W1EHN9_9ZZZZ